MSKKFDTSVVEFDALNLESVSEVRARLRKIWLPWEKDSCHPPKYIRRNGLGAQIAIVDSWLGGYAEPHKPELHGWGFKSCPLGQGSSCSGIRKTMTDAMRDADAFLTSNFEKQGYLILTPVK